MVLIGRVSRGGRSDPPRTPIHIRGGPRRGYLPTLYLPSPHQCGTFTGIIPVFEQNLILFEWYWEVVVESGMVLILILRASLILIVCGRQAAPARRIIFFKLCFSLFFCDSAVETAFRMSVIYP